MIVKAFSQILKETGKIRENKQILIIFIVLDTLGTAFTMKIVDYLMNSVEASNLAIIVISFVIAILSIDKDNTNEKQLN